MATIEERIQEIEDEIKRTKYNKATEAHIGMLKAKIARLQMEQESHRKGGGTGFSLQKSGDASVAFVGYPNVGKSSLLNALTDTKSEVGNYAFTTLKVIPGMLRYHGAQIQLLDLPGIIENAALGTGRGREVLSMVRTADLIILTTDIECKGMDRIIEELRKASIEVNKKRKNIGIKKGSSGGIRIRKPKNVEIDEEQIRMVMKEFKITNAELYIRENVTLDDIIEYFKGNVVYIPAIVAVNKIDMQHDEEKIRSMEKYGKVFPVSAATGIGIDELKDGIYNSLDFVRVYLRNRAGETDFEKPLVLKKGATVREACRKISREMLDSFRYGLVISKNSKIREMRVGIDYELSDGDILTIYTKN
ncbi:OBG GTPase family GTP-binding protein [Caldiplasma sukawensis]